MINMDSDVSRHVQGLNNPRSAVRECIDKQTRTEIEANNQHVVHSDDPFRTAITSEMPIEENIYSYEPFSELSLLYINKILYEQEDDIIARNDPSFSFSELIAYQEKSPELAAIMKEDSPALSLHLRGPSQEEQFCQSGADSTFGSEVPLFEYDGTNFEMGSASASNVAQPYRNDLLLSSLRGPQRQFHLPDVNAVISREADLKDDQVSCHSLVEKRIEQTRADDVEAYTSSHISRHKTSRKDSASTWKKKRASKEGTHEYVDINHWLLQCANEIGVDNTRSAIEILNKVKQHASPSGNGEERLAYYFSEALYARISGMGWSLYMGHVPQRPSSAEILKATYKYMSACPFAIASHHFINRSILNVAKNASVLYILDLQATGYHYPDLFNALASLPGGPPRVRLTGLGFPHYSMIPAKTDMVLDELQQTGRRLSECAAAAGVPFHYTAWAGPRDTLRMQDFVSPHKSSGEVSVVISAYLLRYIMDDTLDSPPVRLKLLKMVRDINADAYIQGIVTGSYSTPFFTRRFREALFHFESVYDMLDTFIDRENRDRVVFESEILGKAILNIVACEGTDVVERIDKYKHWQALTKAVGFKQLPIDHEIKSRIELNLKNTHKEYIVEEDSQYLLMGWKGRMLHAMSAWRAPLVL
ncbi:hypothetical protein KP509_14G090200 [Ceratopteris richardii]|uniref:Uncharacterized protein n=1 Tax=Ceratopteris richardii TaxID=49495 RepID=A0A8T2TA67_CERRI|nr:hypothetical protein KP509_14G090200 [Ceratopteris richardii]